MTESASAFPEQGRQIYVAYENQWAAFAMLVDRMGWMLCLIPSDPAAPDHDGIPTYCLQPKPTAVCGRYSRPHRLGGVLGPCKEEPNHEGWHVDGSGASWDPSADLEKPTV